MKPVAIIPARGGSKGIPGKNLAGVGGKPLIEYIIRSALAVPELDRVLVSTDDPVIAWTAEHCGAEVPFYRPGGLCRDDTPTLPVLQHAVRYLEEQEGFFPDPVVLLYATSPLLSPARISEALKMMEAQQYDSLVSVEEDRGHYWIWGENGYERLYPKNVLNRQKVRPLLKENGALYICTRDLLMNESTLLGGRIGFLIMEPWESIDIDEPADLEVVRLFMESSQADRTGGREAARPVSRGSMAEDRVLHGLWGQKPDNDIFYY
jgi:CMP-N,N'-diacetyllegionaminic acid synthase